MDYGLLPPEINSTRMYAGPGPGSLLAAAGAWGALATELHTTATAYQAAIAALVGGPWRGQAATALAAASTPYITWLQAGSAQAEQVVGQTHAAAAAHEAAFAMTVPPPLIAANRAQLAALVAANALGLNTPAIAAIEAEYGQMWAQDALAMYAYAASAATATRLSEFEPAPQIATPSGLARQEAAVATVTVNATRTAVQDGLSKLTAAIPNTLKSLAVPTSLDQTLAWYGKYITPFMPMATSTSQATSAVVAVTQFMKGLAPVATSAAQALQSGVQALGVAAETGMHSSGAGVAAALGKALPVGGLSAPAGWAAAAPIASPAAAMSTGLAMPSAAAEAGIGGLPMGAPLGALSQSAGQFGGAAPRYGFRPSVMAKPFAAG